MKKIIYFILLSTLMSCNPETVSDKLIERNTDLIDENFVFLEIHYYLDPLKANSTYEKMKELHNEYELIIKKIEIDRALTDDVKRYLKSIENLELVRLDFYEYHNFDILSAKLLKYEIQNLTLQALQNLKFEFYNTYYSSYKTKILTIKKGNVIELYPISGDTLSKPYILVGKLKENTYEFFDKFIEIDSNNKITSEQLTKIGLKNNIEGLIINRTFEGYPDTIRFKKIIK